MPLKGSIPGDDVVVALLDGGSLGVLGSEQLVLEGRDRLYALLLKRLQTRVKRVLGRGQHGG